MQIAFDYQIFGWQEYGGVSRYIYELAIALAEDDKQNVNIICPLFVNQYLKQGAPGVNVYGLPMPAVAKTGRLVRAVNSILAKPIMYKLRPDILHETYYSGVAPLKSRAKRVITVYDMIHEKFPQEFRTGDPTRIQKKLAVERADHVICISEQTQADLVEILNVPPEKTSVVHLRFSLRDNKTLPPQGFQGEPYLLYVGQRGGYKNFESMLRAVASSQQLKHDMRILCFGGGAFNRSERELISRLGYREGDVKQLSGNDSVLASLYTSATAFVYPSLYEGFGIPPLEAMSFGCPVACSRISSIPEVVGPAGAYFDPADVGEIREVLEKLAVDQELRGRLTAAGKERLQNFSWAKNASQTLGIYNNVIGCG